MEHQLLERVAQLEAETFALRLCVRALIICHAAPRIAASQLKDQMDLAASAAVRLHGEAAAVEAFARTNADALPSPAQWRALAKQERPNSQ